MTRFQCSKCKKKYTFNQWLKLVKVPIDPANLQYGYTSVCTCGKEFHKEQWRLLSKEDGYEVSTVHLEMAHLSNTDFNPHTALDEYWYETMIFDPKGKPLSFQVRYKTQEEAKEGHDLTVEMLPKILANPNKYPKSILSMIGVID